MEVEELFLKLKRPSYLLWFLLRVFIGLCCGVIGIFSYQSSGAVNTFLWVLMGAQFLIDGDLIRQSFKINRWYIVIGLFILILITT